jgi:hypothetical protein
MMQTILDSGHSWFLERVLYHNSLEVYIVEGIRSAELQRIEIDGIDAQMGIFLVLTDFVFKEEGKPQRHKDTKTQRILKFFFVSLWFLSLCGLFTFLINQAGETGDNGDQFSRLDRLGNMHLKARR